VSPTDNCSPLEVTEFSFIHLHPPALTEILLELDIPNHSQILRHFQDKPTAS